MHRANIPHSFQDFEITSNALSTWSRNMYSYAS